MAEQLKVEELWSHFQKIAEERLPSAFPRFYKVRMVDIYLFLGTDKAFCLEAADMG